MSRDLVPPYASTRLIAYIGNKRALLPYLRSIFVGLGERAPIRSFLDPFAGSGAVSRLARCLGYGAMANDAEEYSKAVNDCWLGISADEAEALFATEGGVAEVLRSINRFHPERGDEVPPGGDVQPYIARHYAPAVTSLADWRLERLFYTRENAVFLDRARCFIEERWPRDAEGAAAKERALLLGCLVYEAATHANTSGVFKACHKGFGGHGKDALGRIMAPMELEPPLLWAGPCAEVARGDAARFCAGRPADLCYLDPPYNQHQYGSNYHLLNTLARWDRLPVSEERGPDGGLVEKAGIPASWKESRSDFCYRRSAYGAFRGLIESIDARLIVLSYNSEAIVPPAELYDLLAERAEVELRSVEYLQYRGGRQSAERRVHNRELLFIAHRRVGRCGSAADREPALAGLAAELRLSRALGSAFDPGRLAKLADEEGMVSFEGGSSILRLPTYRFLLIERGADELCAFLSPERKERLAALLESAALENHGEACVACVEQLEAGCREKRLQDLALSRLRKIAHRKYAGAFEAAAGRLERAAESGGLERLSARLAELRTLFAARTQG